MAVRLHGYETRRGPTLTDVNELLAMSSTRDKQANKKEKRRQSRKNKIEQSNQSPQLEMKNPEQVYFKGTLSWKHEMPKPDIKQKPAINKEVQTPQLIRGPDETAEQELLHRLYCENNSLSNQ